jgi:hypothetical protein
MPHFDISEILAACGTTAGLGYLEVAWIVLYTPLAVSLCPPLRTIML